MLIVSFTGTSPQENEVKQLLTNQVFLEPKSQDST